jgi:hypothetical protein
MELLFESRLNLNVSGKLMFFQNRPEYHPAPVLEPGPEAVDAAGTTVFGTVIHDQGTFRMWYHGTPTDWDGANMETTCYAESDNGIDWRKPKLGLVDYRGSGRDNNLINIPGHSMSVFVDPDAPPSHRYRATICSGWSHEGSRDENLGVYGFYTVHSADGLSWEYDKKSPQWYHADCITSVYHPGQKRAMVMLKANPLQTVNGMRRRAFMASEFTDGKWSDEANPALVPDEFDDVAAKARGFASADYYGISLMPAGGGTVGLLWQFRHYVPYPMGDGVVLGNFGVVDISLCYQDHPLDRWMHVHGRPDFMRHDDVSWGYGCIYLTSNPIDVGDEQWLYFSATPVTHSYYLDEKWLTDEAAKRTVMESGYARIGLARWPKWRLFGFRADPRGTVEINLGRLTRNSKLYLNYRTWREGSVRAEILHGRFTDLSADPDMKPAHTSLPLTGDSLAEEIQWKSGGNISVNPDKDCVVRLHLDQAEIYAYETVPV